MMKKVINSFYRLLLIITVVWGYVFEPISVNAAIKAGTTLADLRKELRDLQAEQKNKENQKKKTQNEINNNKQNIVSANNQITEAKNEIASLTAEIEKTNNEIEQLKSEISDLLVLYQKLKSENVYLNYVSKASSITELMMRMDAINQITSYNEKQLKKMEMLIKDNEKKSKSLVKYQDTLNSKIDSYQSKIEILGDDLAELMEGVESIESEIQGKKELIDYYEKIGCKENEDLTKCVDIANNSGWLKPLPKGRINSLFGMRYHPTQKVWKLHSGVDIGGNSEGTKIYSTAAGVVGKITRKSSCGGNMVYVWVYVNGKPYTIVFMHLLEIKVDVGQKVTTDTVIGLQGGGVTKSYDKCTTGTHLHYSVSQGNHYLKTKSDTYSKYVAGLIDPPGYPGLYKWFYSR